MMFRLGALICKLRGSHRLVWSLRQIHCQRCGLRVTLDDMEERR